MIAKPAHKVVVIVGNDDDIDPRQIAQGDWRWIPALGTCPRKRRGAPAPERIDEYFAAVNFEQRGGVAEPRDAQTRLRCDGECGGAGMHDRNGCVGRNAWLGFAKNEVQERSTRIDPDGLRVLELTVMPLRRLLCPRQSLALRFRAESRATGVDGSADQRDQQRESDTRPQHRAQRPAAGCGIRLPCWQWGSWRSQRGFLWPVLATTVA